MKPEDINQTTIEQALQQRLPRRDTSSAVLIPLIPSFDGWDVLFEIRSDSVSQPGEVSFPGGHLEEDESSIDAVLRETCEELGIPSSAVTLLGELPRERIQGFRLVKPYVGAVDPEALNKVIHSDEVAGIFTVPLAYLMRTKPEKYKYRLSILEDKTLPTELQKHLAVERPYSITLYWEYDGYGIWGLTARILNNLLHLIKTYEPA